MSALNSQIFSRSFYAKLRRKIPGTLTGGELTQMRAKCARHLPQVLRTPRQGFPFAAALEME